MPLPDTAAQRAVLDRVGSLERERAVLYAKEARAHAEMAALWGADPGVCVELAGTARCGQDRAGGQLVRDERLVTLFPIALGLLELGVMRVATVEILLSVSKNARQEVQQLLDTRLSERICPMDAADARALIVATIPELEGELGPAAQQERYEQARANRGVWSFPVEDGMARIGAEIDQISARRWALDFEELVRAQKVRDDRDGVKRTQAQRRADVFAQLPSRMLALVDAATRGELEALLREVAAEHAAAAGAESSEVAASDTVGSDLDADVAVDDVVALEPSADVRGMDELPLGLEPALPRPWWDLDRDELLVGLLRLPVRTPVVMNIHTGMTTMLDLDQRSGWLEGFGPVSAMQARMLLPNATLRRVGVDERTGIPLGVDPPRGPEPPWSGELDLAPGGSHASTRSRRDGSLPRASLRAPTGGHDAGPPGPDTAAQPGPSAPEVDVPMTPAQVQRYRLFALLGPMYVTDRAEPQHDPSTAMRALARLRDQRCDGPGCPRTASACELDHEEEYAQGGQTAIWNLKHRSTRCHICKHHGWTVDHDHDTGVSVWNSPAGSVYVRLSPWQPPPDLPDDLELPEPRLVEPIDLPPDRYEADAEWPLWREPLPCEPRAPRRPSGFDPDDLDESGNPIPPAPRPMWSTDWDEGPPPF